MSKQLKKFTKSIQNSFKRNSISETRPTTLKAKLMLSVAAIGSFFMPWGGHEVHAGEIYRSNLIEGNLMQNGKADIYAEATYNKIGLNRFHDFNVDKNEIANLHFKDSPTSNVTLNS